MSNIVITAPTDESGLYKKGFLHKDGGIAVTVDDTTPVEVEVKEYKLCRDALDNTKVYDFKDKTNLEILDEMFQDANCIFETHKAESGDFILCRLVVLDKAKHDRRGTVREIINQMQSEKSCRISQGDATGKHQEGGFLSANDDNVNSDSSPSEFVDKSNGEGDDETEVPPGEIRICAGLAVVWNGKIFLGHPTNAKWFGSYGIPKGGVEPEETLLMAALRESQEETGLTLRQHVIDRLNGQQPHKIEYYRKNARQYKIVNYFLVRIDDIKTDTNMPGEIIPQEWLQVEEMDWAGFVDFEDAKKRMTKRQLVILKEALNADSRKNPNIYQDGGDLTVQPMSAPAYLMTLDEYQKQVAPIIAEYSKFIKKNNDYLAKAAFNGLYHYTYPEMLDRYEQNDLPASGRFHKSKYDNHLTPKQQADRSWLYATTGVYPRDYHFEYTPNNPAPIKPGIFEEKQQYINRLKQFFSDEVIFSKFEDDEKKSNKRAVRRAIESGDYAQDIKEGRITYDRLQEIFNSVGISKLPKNLIEAKQKRALSQGLFDDLVNSVPKVNREQMIALLREIDASFADFAEQIFVDMKEKYVHNIEKIKSSQDITKDLMSGLMPYTDIFMAFDSKPVRIDDQSYTDSLGKRVKLIYQYFAVPKIVPDWEVRLDRNIRDEIQAMKVPMMQSIISNFEHISLPITAFKKIYVNVSPRSRGHVFEGAFDFEFVNGSSFVYKTEAIRAGGHTIQRLHLRYISDFMGVKLVDGTTIPSASLYEIIKNFSVPEKKLSLFDQIQGADSIEAIIGILYNLIKETGLGKAYSPRRFPKSLGFKEGDHYGMRSLYFTKPQSNDLMDLPDAKRKALKFLQERGVNVDPE